MTEDPRISEIRAVLANHTDPFSIYGHQGRGLERIRAIVEREPPSIDVYPVGLLHDWQHRRMRPLRRALRYPFNQARRGNWRAVRNYFNGYLAEPTPMQGRRCGRGWTKRRAYRSLAIRLIEVQP